MYVTEPDASTQPMPTSKEELLDRECGTTGVDVYALVPTVTAPENAAETAMESTRRK